MGWRSREIRNVRFGIRNELNQKASLRNQGYFLIYEDHSGGYVYPQNGVFHKYVSKSFNERIDPLKTLNELKDHNILVIDSWFRDGMNGCSPPGSNSYTQTIYPPVFIVMLEKSNPDIESYDFEILEDPKPIPCGYVVERFVLMR